jgi:Family of unknown function (DUF6476)
MPDPVDAPQLPPGLRFLNLLVIVLMITMIVGVITVVWLLVTRMPDGNALPALPATLALPEGAVALSITQGPGWIGVVTQDSRFLIFAPDGSLRQEITVAP